MHDTEQGTMEDVGVSRYLLWQEITAVFEIGPFASDTKTWPALSFLAAYRP